MVRFNFTDSSEDAMASRFLLAIAVMVNGSIAAFGSDPHVLVKDATWVWPDANRTADRLTEFVQTRGSANGMPDLVAFARETANKRGIGLLEQVIAVAAKIDPTVASFRDRLREPWSAESVSAIEPLVSTIMANGAIPEWLKSDLQLAYCRQLVHHQLYDEALARLLLLNPESISDPATWLFCMAVCQHHLLQQPACVETLDRLLERETEIPTRYAITARLMQSDIQPLKENSLDEIARIMNDVERRLNLGRAGKQLRDRQQQNVDKLDKMIDRLEQQQQQQQQQRQQQRQQRNNPGNPNQGKSQRPSDGLDESRIAGDKGPGEVDPKNLGNGQGWGNLPPAQRQEALQNITKDLPSHYREVIEAYFKRLATTTPPSDRRP